MFADDNQLFRLLNPNSILSQTTAKSDLETCINGLSTWLFQNKLKLNESKTELLIIGKKTHLAKMEYNTVTIGNESITAKPCAKNLGVHIDEELTMRTQIINVVRTCNYQLRVLWSIRRFLDIEASKTLATSLILSRLDYCNSLYFGLPDVLIDKLQKVQNSAARFVFKMKKSDHISQALMRLHWLPIRYRIKFKIALLTFKSLHGEGPSYLQDLLQKQTKARTTRSHDSLKVPRTKLKTAGDRAFSAAAPKVWNALPFHITSSNSTQMFKKKLKTHLFRIAFP